MKIANRKAREFVKKRLVFAGNNIFSEKLAKGYVVYSYGTHYPMYVYSTITKTWYSNKDRYSVTTSKHKSQCSPVQNCKERNTEHLHDIIKILK